MAHLIGKVIFRISKFVLAKFGFSINLGANSFLYPELSKQDIEFIRRVTTKSLSMTSFESLCTLAIVCKHISNQHIEGDFVEAGVWRGGSSLVARNFLKGQRLFYLFDTYGGMTTPTEFDFRIGEKSNHNTVAKWRSQTKQTHNEWVYASIDEVTQNFNNFNLLDSSVIFCKGDVRETLFSESLPDQIAILRLDTDFYDSTLVELQVLWPRLVTNGILILDDYGHWDGARKAVDEYFRSLGLKDILMIPIAGGGGRIVFKN